MRELHPEKPNQGFKNKKSALCSSKPGVSVLSLITDYQGVTTTLKLATEGDMEEGMESSPLA